MKTAQSTNKTIGLGAFLALALATIVLSACAGPAQYGTNAIPITTTKEAATVKPHDTILMVCGACKTVDLVDAVYGRSPSSEIDQYGYEWLKVGTKHKCDHCGGEITVVKGKTADSMQHNCSKCGEGAAFCCVAPAADAKE
jgi:hypothetical protein